MKTAPRFNSARFREALIYAAQLHAAQTRKGTDTPYIAHLLAVASIVIEYGGGETEAIAALLHDAVEDQCGRQTLERIRALFGEDVASIVDSCTDAYADAGERKPEWRPRKERYLAHLPEASPAARLVSCADKLHNARAILQDYRTEGETLWSRFTGGRAGLLWYYRALADSFMKTDKNPLAEELNRVVSEIERLAARDGKNADT